VYYTAQEINEMRALLSHEHFTITACFHTCDLIVFICDFDTAFESFQKLLFGAQRA
jgi:hypothetical protein